MARKRKHKPRQVKPVKLSFPVFDYNPIGLKSRTEKELRKEYSRLRSIARKRLERMTGTEFTRSETYKYNVGRFKQLQDISSNVELRHLTVDLARFLLAESGSLVGQKEIKIRTIQRFHNAGFKFVDSENYWDWLDFLHYVREMEGYVYNEDALKDAFKEAMREGVSDDTAAAYEYYKENTGRGAYIPSE